MKLNSYCIGFKTEGVSWDSSSQFVKKKLTFSFINLTFFKIRNYQLNIWDSQNRKRKLFLNQHSIMANNFLIKLKEYYA